MSTISEEIKFLLNNLPYAAEIYDSKGKLIDVNIAWKTLWNYTNSNIPKLSIFKNRLLLKTGKIKEIEKLLDTGESVRTMPVLCELGDLNFTQKGSEQFFKFYFFCLKDRNEKVSHLVNLIELVTDKIHVREIDKELESQKREVSTSLELLEEERKRVAQELHDVIGQKILL